MIEEIQSATGHGRRRICQVLGVPRSSYYHAARPTVTQQSDDDIGVISSSSCHASSINVKSDDNPAKQNPLN